MILYDTLPADTYLATRVRRTKLPQQGGTITKQDVRTITRRAVGIDFQDKKTLLRFGKNESYESTESMAGLSA